VQNKSRAYRLQGSHRLQFRLDLSEIENRFASLESLLTTLGQEI